jgi:uncharacterized DUF497 family protein
MSFTFEWDDEKALENLRKHDISFSEASTVFADPLSRTISRTLTFKDRRPVEYFGRVRPATHLGGGAYPS